MPLIFPKDREQWLKIRANNVSSTESAALFGLSPYSTPFELAVLKKAYRQDDPSTYAEYEKSERMQWGARLQRAIAEGVGEDYGVKIRAITGYSIMEGHKMGASFDFEVVGRVQSEFSGDETLRAHWSQHGPGVLEIKNVDAWVFKKDWHEVDGQVEAPAHIELQVQHQLECIDREWAAIGVLVGGNRQVLLIRKRDREVGAKIVEKVDRFYAMLARGEMPPVALPQDADIIRRLYGHADPGSVLDFQTTPNAELHALVKAHAEATADKSAAEKHHKSTGAALMMALGTAEKALFADYTVSAGVVGPTRVEAYDRAGYRNLRVYAKGAKK